MAGLAGRLEASLASMEAEAARLDREGGFPEQAFACLRDAGGLTAPLPRHMGGEGLGTEPEGAIGLLDALRALGRANLPAARLWEGHVNALQLIALYGTPSQLEDAARDAADGHLFGIWVTSGAEGLRLAGDASGLRLAGGKRFASGARHVTRPLVTARPPEASGEDQMLLLRIEAGRYARDMVDGLHGMRAAGTGNLDFTGLAVDCGWRIGGPGDYLREPAFSGGAWRGSAAALGGIDRLAGLLREQLDARRRAGGAYQLHRIGHALIARETAAMWTMRAARIAESPGQETGDVAGLVNLARIAVEAAALDVIRLVQRGLGLQAFAGQNPAERVMRDLATYLRQPAPDEALAEAAAWFTRREPPH